MAAETAPPSLPLMQTPLTDAVGAYLAGDPARFHTPGHKGVALPWLTSSWAHWDVTEVTGTDSLYEAAGAIGETEAAYRQLYGTAGTLLSAGGSTLCIQTMLALAVPQGGKVLCARGVHTAAINAMALLDLHPIWIYPDTEPSSGLSSAVTASQVETALTAHPDAGAVYLTSPSYFGLISDVAAVSQVCRRFSVPLLVDNAHGAHLKFLATSLHPIDLGADLCCDSLHKTLPVFTGGALLHVGNPRFLPDAKRRMSLFGSTSPSYPILLSADGALPYLAEGVHADLRRVTAEIATLEQLAADAGYLLPEGVRDPIRLSVGFGPLGLSEEQFRAHLQRHHVEPEYCSAHFCVFLASGHSSPADFHRLRVALLSAPAAAEGPGRPYHQDTPPFPILQQVMPLRQAVLSPCRWIPVEEGAGHIAAGTVAPCPPGIPLVVPGEEITQQACTALKKYGNFSIPVVH